MGLVPFFKISMQINVTTTYVMDERNKHYDNYLYDGWMKGTNQSKEGIDMNMKQIPTHKSWITKISEENGVNYIENWIDLNDPKIKQFHESRERWKVAR